MNDLIHAKLKKIVMLQDIIKNDDLNYKLKRGKLNFAYIYYLFFLRDTCEGHLSIEKADNNQSNFTNKLKNFEKGAKQFEKKY